jgi:protein involved in polysaccharide export with SLBB domain
MYKKLAAICAIALATAALPASAQIVITNPFGSSQASSVPLDASTTAAAKAVPVAVPAAPADASNPVPDARMQPPQFYDYSANLASDVFGARLFTGAFARQGVTQFNPDYVLTVGDKIQVRLWGAFDFDAPLTVDPKGNILLPHAGPVQVLGARNQDVQRLVEAAVAKVFRTNVFSYATLAAAQPVRIFVSGFVNRPGLYNGSSMDSLLHFLDQAGGIDPERGSFLLVQVKRGQQVRGTVNLYDFLLDGTMPAIQLSDGDVIFVAARQNTVKVSGLAENARRFEFSGNERTVGDLLKMARPNASATHVRIGRNTGTVQNVEYVPLADAGRIALQNGDELEFTADKKLGTITVRVEGEHQSAQEYVLPYGARMGDLLPQIQYSERSDKDNLQLFRLSVKDRQRLMLQSSLRSLEVAALTARSGTSDEARLRKDEADLLLQWVDRAKKVEPSGQVLIAESASRNSLLLENGDILRVPTRDGLVLVSGEVLFPNAVMFDKKLQLADYLNKAGGYTQNAESSRIVVAHRDGSFAEADSNASIFSFGAPRVDIRAGDEILVLPKIDVKNRQIWKDMTQILYQVAISAKVVLGL